MGNTCADPCCREGEGGRERGRGGRGGGGREGGGRGEGGGRVRERKIQGMLDFEILSGGQKFLYWNMRGGVMGTMGGDVIGQCLSSSSRS